MSKHVLNVGAQKKQVFSKSELGMETRTKTTGIKQLGKITQNLLSLKSYCEEQQKDIKGHTKT